MQLPDDVQQFRNLSLLHDTALTPSQRQGLLGKIPTECLFAHQIFVKKLLGASYYLVDGAKNRAKPALLGWIFP